MRKQRMRSERIRTPQDDRAIGRDRGGVKVRSAAEMPATIPGEDDNPGDEIE
jgi:hypothetical protein